MDRLNDDCAELTIQRQSRADAKRGRVRAFRRRNKVRSWTSEIQSPWKLRRIYGVSMNSHKSSGDVLLTVMGEKASAQVRELRAI